MRTSRIRAVVLRCRHACHPWQQAATSAMSRPGRMITRL